MFADGQCTIPAIQRALRVGYQRASRLFYGLYPKAGSESDVTILNGDAMEMLRTLPDESVQCCVTSPPYWGLRDYGCAGQIGMEASYQEYVSNIVGIFAQVWRVLKSDGTLWLNLGDCYATGAGKVGECPGGGEQGDRWKGYRGTRPGSPKHADNAMGPMTQANRMPQIGLKPKDLVGIPWRVALALQESGWYLRSDIIWNKPNPMPESVTDRPTKSHEYIFLLTKSERYFYDHEAIKEKCVSDHDAGNGFDGRQGGAAHLPMSGGTGTKEPWTRKKSWNGSKFDDGKNLLVHPNVGKRTNGKWSAQEPQTSGHRMVESVANARAKGNSHDSPFGESRNKRSVWTISTIGYPEAHFATFPPTLITPCILAGSRPGDAILDPFGGSGTTGAVALELGRRAILIELNPDYVKLIERRTSVTKGLGL